MIEELNQIIQIVEEVQDTTNDEMAIGYLEDAILLAKCILADVESGHCECCKPRTEGFSHEYL